MKLSFVTPPLYLPVSLGEAKTHLRIESTYTSDDAYIQALLMASTEAVQDLTSRKLITQTWKYFLDRWPGGDFIKMPYGKLQSVTSIKYKDSSATEYTMDAGDYIVDADSDPGRIVLDYVAVWPSETLSTSNPIYIEYACGYGAHTPVTITGATNASPIVITSGTHGLVTGDRVIVSDVLGNTAANGIWIVTKLTDDAVSLNGSTGNADYTSGASIATVSNTDIDTGTETVDSFADTIGDGAYWDYVVKKGANLRTGRVTATWDATGNTVEYIDVSTADIGDTSGVTLSVDISGDLVRLRCTVLTDDWSVSGTRKVIAVASDTYTSGGTITKLSVPDPIRHAILLLVADMFEGRGDPFVGQTMIESKTIDRLLASYQLWDEF